MGIMLKLRNSRGLNVDISKLPLFQVMQSKLRHDGARQAVLAQNIANVDTPGYKAREVAPPDFGKIVTGNSALSMAVTNPKHMQGNTAAAGSGGTIVKRKTTYELNPIQNNVVIEEEMMHVADTQADYQQTLGIYRKSLNLFNIALGKANAS